MPAPNLGPLLSTLLRDHFEADKVMSRLWRMHVSGLLLDSCQYHDDQTKCYTADWQQLRQALGMAERLLLQKHRLRGQSAATCLQATLEDAAFKEHREEQKLLLAQAAQQRRDAPPAFQQPLQKKVMTEADKKSAYDQGRLDLCHDWQAGKCTRGPGCFYYHGPIPPAPPLHAQSTPTPFRPPGIRPPMPR